MSGYRPTLVLVLPEFARRIVGLFATCDGVCPLDGSQ